MKKIGLYMNLCMSITLSLALTLFGQLMSGHISLIGFLVSLVLSLAASFLTETPRLPSGTVEWLGIVMLAAVCSCFGFTLQPVAQSGTTAERAGMFCALNPMVAAVLGVVFLHEPFTGKTIVGGILILLGILLAELPESQKKRSPFSLLYKRNRLKAN